MFRSSALALSMLIVAWQSPASAQLSSTSPFTGSASEGFETQDTSGGAFPVCVVDRVFGGQADLCTITGSGAHITGGWGFGCSLSPHGNGRLFGGAGNPVVYTFDSTVLRFGGYFATNNPNASNGTAKFYDAAGTLLFTDTITAPNDCTWTWNGWDTGGVPIKSIEVYSNYSSGGYMMMDDMEADSQPTTVGIPFCFCDTTGMPAPCANTGGVGRGCGNSTYSTGARLSASGLASVSQSTLKLHGEDIVGGWPGIYFQGTVMSNGGSGMILGDGLRCTGLSVVRLETVVSGASTVSETSLDLSVAGGNSVLAGDTRFYQLWYRDAAGSTCGNGFNLSNAIEITWIP